MATQAPAKSDTEPVAGSPAVRLTGIRRAYGEVVAIEGLDLEIAEGEFFTLLGPSGSGKTTTLRVIAGFERPDKGRVELAGVDVTNVAPSQRDLNTVFQDYALFPHMTVLENVEYGLRVKGIPRKERRSRRPVVSSGICSKRDTLDHTEKTSSALHLARSASGKCLCHVYLKVRGEVAEWPKASVC